MIVRALNVTIATASMPNSVSQAIHSDVENITKDEAGCFSCEKEENDHLVIMKLRFVAESDKPSAKR